MSKLTFTRRATMSVAVRSPSVYKSHFGGLTSPPAGSTTVHPYNDKTLEPVELGASIFVEVNRNLWRASEEFNLTRIDYAAGGNDQLGIWDGTQFLFTVRHHSPI